MAQPTIRRLQASSTTATYRKPAPVGTYVNIGDPQAVRPSDREVAVDQVGGGVGVAIPRGGDDALAPTYPCTAAARMSRATRLRPTRTPWAASSACTRGAP